MKKRPEELNGETIRCNTECGSMFLTRNYYKGKLVEVRCVLGKCGNCSGNMLIGITRLISSILQTDLEKKLKKKKIKTSIADSNCSMPVYYNGEKFDSCVAWMAHMIISKLDEEIKDERKEERRKAKEDQEDKEDSEGQAASSFIGCYGE